MALLCSLFVCSDLHTMKMLAARIHVVCCVKPVVKYYTQVSISRV